MATITDRRNPCIKFSPEPDKLSPGAKQIRYIDFISNFFGTLFFEDWSRYAIPKSHDSMYFYGADIMPQLIEHVELAIQVRSVERGIFAYSVLHFLNEYETKGFYMFL